MSISFSQSDIDQILAMQTGLTSGTDSKSIGTLSQNAPDVSKILSGQTPLKTDWSQPTVVDNSKAGSLGNIGDFLGGKQANDGKTQTVAKATPTTKSATKAPVPTAKPNTQVTLTGKPDPIKSNITADQIALPKALADLSPETIAASADSQKTPDHTENKPDGHPQQGKPEEHKPQQQSFLGALTKLATLAGLGWAISSLFAGGGHRNENHGRNGKFASNGFNGFGNYKMINQEQNTINHIQSLLAHNKHMDPRQRAYLESKLVAEQDKYDNYVNRMSQFFA